MQRRNLNCLEHPLFGPPRCAPRRLLPGLLLPLLLACFIPRFCAAVQVQLDVLDESGNEIPARIQAKDAQGNYWPPDTSTVLMSHNDWPWMRAYFYHQGPVTMDLSPGAATILVGHGIESRPVRIRPAIRNDTSIVITIRRQYDMRSLGWYSGETHTHMTHIPSEYNMVPAQMHEIAQAEDLAMTWILDNLYQFTGGPHIVSTPDAILYFTTEYRNQAYGHAALLGLKHYIGHGCCSPPDPALPMLSDVEETWNPGWDEVMTLAHPCDGAGFFDDEGQWPSAGLAREVPVQVTSGDLQVYDVTSYSNAGDLALEDWYRLLNCGFHIPPGSGTDAVMNRYWTRPAGGYRAYVKESGQNDPSHWVEAYKAGRTFVTNYPLIPEFTVDGQDAGSTLDRDPPSAVVSVHFVVESVLPVSTAKIIVNGEVASTFSVPSGLNGSYGVFDTQLTLNESSWIALRVDGVTDIQHACNSNLFAHTGPVYVRLGGLETFRTAPAGYFQDWCDSLQIFVENRGNWPSDSSHAHVLARIQSARTAFGRYFTLPPSTFQLLSPAEAETVDSSQPAHFDWDDASDPESGDRIRYQVSISPDTTFSSGYQSPLLDQSELTVQIPLPGDQAYWWRVAALDRGGNTTGGTPAFQMLFLRDNTSAVGAGSRPAAPLPRVSAWPNPATGQVHFQWNQPQSAPGAFEIFDTGGRLVARIGSAALSGGPGGCPSRCPTAVWDGTDAAGRKLASGLYWIRYRPGSALPGSRESTVSGRRDLQARFLFLR